MSTVTRDEFEVVKELLASAARYAESAHRGMDRLETAQQQSQLQIDRIGLKIEQLTEAQKRTDERLESFIDRTGLKIEQLTEAQKRTDERLESFIVESQRQSDRIGLKIEQLTEAQKRTDERLESFIDRTGLKIEQLTEAQKRTDERLESFIFESQRLITGQAERVNQLEGITARLEAILAYLLRKEGPGE